MHKNYLTIDIGASSGRHIVGWMENGVLRTEEVYRFPNSVRRVDGHLEWDIHSLFVHVKQGIREAFAKYPEIESLSIDTWAVDYVLLKDGQSLSPVYAYRDKVNIALDYFDASINRISAWTVGFRNVEKALLSALCVPHTALKELQDTNQFTELMVRQEELKTLPFGEVWDEYCRRNGVPADGAWFEEVKKYEQNVLCKRI